MDLLDHLPDLRGARALDVATGPGTLARELAGRFEAVVAIDLPDVLARTAPAPHPGVNWVGMDAEALAFDDGGAANDGFDAACISWSLHHLRDPRRVLREMRRVLRPGGRLVVFEPFVAWTGRACDHYLRAHMLGAHLDRARGLGHEEIFPRQRVEALVGGLGLSDLRIEIVVPADGAGIGDDREAQIARWAGYMDRTAEAPEVLPLVREAARACAAAIRRDGVATGPFIVAQGRA